MLVHIKGCALLRVPLFYANWQRETIMTQKKQSNLEALRRKRQEKLNHEIADWQTANPEIVLHAIAVVAFNGGALRFGYTRDGGAYAIGIYLGGESFTEYVRPHEDIDSYLSALASDVGGTA